MALLLTKTRGAFTANQLNNAANWKMGHKIYKHSAIHNELYMQLKLPFLKEEVLIGFLSTGKQLFSHG